MKKLLWLIPLLLFACKKNQGPQRILINQQPVSIEIYYIDTATSEETFAFSFTYFYNEVARRFDSVFTRTFSDHYTYAFNYSKLFSNNTILLNFRDSSSEYSEYILNNLNNTMTAYHDYSPLHGKTGYEFQYDAYGRLSAYNYISFPALSNFSRTFSYKNDSVIIHTFRASDNCNAYDTIISSPYELNNNISYLLITGMFGYLSCGTTGITMERALPYSAYVNKLPVREINGDLLISYEYTGDIEGRLANVLITKSVKSTGTVTDKLRIRFSY